MDFSYFLILHVIQVKKSISRSFTKLPCSGDLKNPCQLPVSEVLYGTFDLILWISVISTILTSWMSMNLFLKVLHNHVRMTSKIFAQLPVLQELEGTDNLVLCIFVISSLPTFSRSRNIFIAVSQTYHVRMTSKIQVNFRFRKYSRVLSIESHGFQLFLQYLRFRCQGICLSCFTKLQGSGDFENSG